MSQHLPLVAAQPGIWMAEKLSDLPSAWSVAHYVELTGEVDAPLLARAVVAGLAQADTLRMRFTEDNGEVWQWSMMRRRSNCQKLSTCEPTLIRTVLRGH